MIRADYLKDLNKVILTKLYALSDDFHNNQLNIIHTVNLIKANQEYYEKNNVDVSKVFDPINRDKLVITKVHSRTLEKKQLYLLKRYNYVIYQKPYHLRRQLKVLENIRDISYTAYITIQNEINKEIVATILRGNRHFFGKGLGFLYIKFINRTPKFQTPIDWGRSNKFKQLLISQGKKPYHSLHAMDGVKWRIFREDDFFLYYKWWRKFIKSTTNANCYKFTSRESSTSAKALKECNTLEDILYNDSVASRNKLIAIQNKFPELIEEYKKHAKYLYQ